MGKPATANDSELELESAQKHQEKEDGLEPLVPMRSLLNQFAVEFCNKESIRYSRPLKEFGKPGRRFAGNVEPAQGSAGTTGCSPPHSSLVGEGERAAGLCSYLRAVEKW